MTQTTLEILNRNVSELKEELKILRSFVIGVLGKDKEGEYRPEFVKKILKLATEEAPLAFRNKKEFIKRIQIKS